MDELEIDADNLREGDTFYSRNTGYVTVASTRYEGMTVVVSLVAGKERRDVGEQFFDFRDKVAIRRFEMIVDGEAPLVGYPPDSGVCT